MSLIHCANHRLTLVIAKNLALRCLVDQLLIELEAALESLGNHSFRRLHRLSRLFGERQIHRPELGPEEARCREGFEFFLLTHSFQTLTNVDERGNDRIARAENFCHPSTEVWACHCLRRHIAGVPVILMP